MADGQQVAGAVSVRSCSICGEPIPDERLAQWHWAKTCSKPCSQIHAIRSRQRAQRRYQRRRRAAIADAA